MNHGRLCVKWIGKAVKGNDRGLLWGIIPTLAQKSWGTWYQVSGTKFKSETSGLKSTRDIHSTMTFGYSLVESSYIRVTTLVHAHSSALWTWTWNGRERRLHSPVLTAQLLHKSKCNFTLLMMNKSIITDEARLFLFKRGSGISTNDTDVTGKLLQKIQR
jgi:hypothetical protein